MASSFDIARPGAVTAAVTLFEDLRTAPFGVAQFAVRNDGTLVYAAGRPQNMTTFVWVDRHGRSRSAGLPEARYSTFDLSPDGTRVAFGEEATDGRVTQIWLVGLTDHRKSSLTARVTTGEPRLNGYPRWTPDGRGVVWTRRPAEGVFQLALQAGRRGRAAGGTLVEQQWRARLSRSDVLLTRWHRDDCLRRDGTGGFDIVRFSRDERTRHLDAQPRILLADAVFRVLRRGVPGRPLAAVHLGPVGARRDLRDLYPTPGAMHKVSEMVGTRPRGTAPRRSSTRSGRRGCCTGPFRTSRDSISQWCRAAGSS